MPLEIKELIIRTRIVDDLDGSATPTNHISDAHTEDRLVEKCMREVIKKLTAKNKIYNVRNR